MEFLYKNLSKFKENIAPVIQIHEQYATLLLKSGQPLKALEYAQKGHKVAWNNQQFRRLFSIWTLIGNIHVTLGRLREAQICYRKALSFSKYVSDSPDRIGRTHLYYGKLLISLEEHQKAEQQLSNAVKFFKTIKGKEIYLIEALINLGHLKKRKGIIAKSR